MTIALTPTSTRTARFDGNTLTAAVLRAVAEGSATAVISKETMEQAAHCRQIFEELASSNTPIYGVTTGYGEMIYMLVDSTKESELQTNLVRSHSAGVGPYFSETEARAIVAARLNALAKGHSAVRPEVLDRLRTYLELGITPAVPEIGSLGASGDLAPLAHVALSLIGEGYVLEDGRPVKTADVLKRHDLQPLTLRFKEGLALINGTSAMTGVGSLLVSKTLAQVRQAEAITALVLEALRCSTSPFLVEGHDIAKPHPGQITTARNLRRLLSGSRSTREHAQLRAEAQITLDTEGDVHKSEVYIQKAYSLRAIPQILGAVRDTLAHATRVVEIELNSANDNPLFFEGEEVFHGANFHGQPVAFVMDFLTIALTQLGVLSERRTNRLLNRHLSDGLPEFLVAHEPGLNSGFAGAQYPATALVAEHRTIGPASTQSVPSNGDNQDVVSMGLIATRNARRVLGGNQSILAVELLAAAQAVDLNDRYTDLSPAGRTTYEMVRELVPTLRGDRMMADDIRAIETALAAEVLVDRLTERGITLD